VRWRPGIVASAPFAFRPSRNELLNVPAFIRDDRDMTVRVGSNLLIYGDVFHSGSSSRRR
jgi:hypothetical protein